MERLYMQRNQAIHFVKCLHFHICNSYVYSFILASVYKISNVSSTEILLCFRVLQEDEMFTCNFLFLSCCRVRVRDWGSNDAWNSLTSEFKPRRKRDVNGMVFKVQCEQVVYTGYSEFSSVLLYQSKHLVPEYGQLQNRRLSHVIYTAHIDYLALLNHRGRVVEQYSYVTGACQCCELKKGKTKWTKCSE